MFIKEFFELCAAIWQSGDITPIQAVDLIGYLNAIMGLIFGICYSYQFFYAFASFFIKPKQYPATKQQNRYAILISARNEKNVIGQLIDSIHGQDYPRELIDIYVVADNCTDNTAEIAASKGAFVYERFDKTRIGKGYAMEYLTGQIRASKQSLTYYSAYLILDADNLLEPNYLTEMDKCFSAGNRIITSHRNTKNFSDNWISSSYALWFMHEARNLQMPRDFFGTSCNVSGTGFMVHSEILEKQGGWKHFLLTEDLEFSVDEIIKGERIAYCDSAMFYDEQPVKFIQSVKQRERWAKGYVQVLCRHVGGLIKGIFKGSFACYDMIMSIMPAFVVSIACVLLNSVAAIIAVATGNFAFLPGLALKIGELLLSSYFVMFLVGGIAAITDWHNIKASTGRKIWATFTFPIFMLTFIPISIGALFKRVGWAPIEHNAALTLESVNKTQKKK